MIRTSRFHRRRWTSFATLSAMLVAFACDDAPTPTVPDPAAPAGTGGLLSGRVDTDMGTFSLPSGTATSPGAFLLRGSNIAFDAKLGALSVDLTLTNRRADAFAEPVTMTFLNLLPEGVTILNADNEETGPGASFDVGFANDDGMWTEGEESDPFTVQFGMSEPLALGFVSRVDVGMSPLMGHIGGVVWNDADEDGQIGLDETGVGNVGIVLRQNGDILEDARTGEDGTYRFDGLTAGLYSVEKRAGDSVIPTTPTTLSVLLVDTKGGVSSFDTANFGCIPRPDQPDDDIALGDVIVAVGHYDDTAGALLAREIDEADEDGDSPKGDMRGPLTGVHPDDHAVSIMGVRVSFGEDAEVLPGGANECGEAIGDLEPGMRVYAKLLLPHPEGSDDPLHGRSLRCWHGEPDKVKGPVEELIEEEGQVIGYRVNRVLVLMSDHGDDDHDDDSSDTDD